MSGIKKLSEYTKAERHRIYKAAKKQFSKWIKDEHSGFFGGMCDAIAEIIEKMDGFHPGEDVFEIGDEFPEMKSIKPKILGNEVDGFYRIDGFYWWPTKNTEIRLEMFDKIIKMTEQ